jgi:Putative Ig domain
MLRVNLAFRHESGGFSQRPKIVVALALMACSLYWTGCAGFSQGSLPSPQTVLPSASVGTSYQDTLSVSGTLPPYSFGVSQGQLPAGLSLDSTTGSISGIPTRAGAFTFKITVTGGATGSGNGATSTASVVRAYALSVLASGNNGNPITVQISPFDPSVAAGGKVQFSAAVSNTSNTAVNWSASAGTISSTGLFTAPTTGSPGSITITASSVAASTAQASTPVTITSVNPVTVQISPLDPSVPAGGRLQFSAAVSNTSNTAVSWSASAGTISSAGLFTAPTTGFPTPITITVTSAAASAAQASTAVTITSTNSPLIITTSSVPSAVEATPYSASLTASGGRPPYQWNVVSGPLPAGVQLNATTGTLAGTATQSGTFPFTVRATDAASRTAQHSFTLGVSNTAKTCGPPAYDCSRSDLAVVQLPTPPNVGNLSGANTIVTDPNFGNRIVRITDANTNPAARFKNRTFVTTSSGSADDNLWNIDSTLFTVQDTGTNTYLYSFNPSTLQAARMYASSFPATKGLVLPVSSNWSRVNSNVLYTDSGTVLYKYDFTNRTNPPSPQLVYDFTSSPNCLPVGFKPTWSTKGGLSADDTVFAMAYSNSGSQGTGIYAVVYKVGSGCSVLNTQTGQVGGDWGAKGTIDIPDRWTIHNVKLSKDGNWLILSSTTCYSVICTLQPYFWQVGTTTVSSCGVGGSCSGHFTEGYTHWVNLDNSPMSNQVIRSFYQPTSVRNLSSDFPPGIIAPLDQHQSWNNADPADSLPFFSLTWSTISPFPAPWYNEIIGVAVDGSGKTWRFAHSFITARSQRFSTAYAIGTVSQDGRFIIFSSDWMGKLGSESGTTTCTVGTNCRGDVFVVELR